MRKPALAKPALMASLQCPLTHQEAHGAHQASGPEAEALEALLRAVDADATADLATLRALELLGDRLRAERLAGR